MSRKHNKGNKGNNRSQLMRYQPLRAVAAQSAAPLPDPQEDAVDCPQEEAIDCPQEEEVIDLSIQAEQPEMSEPEEPEGLLEELPEEQAEDPDQVEPDDAEADDAGPAATESGDESDDDFPIGLNCPIGPKGPIADPEPAGQAEVQEPPADPEPAAQPDESEAEPSAPPIAPRREYTLWELIRHPDYDTIRPDAPDANSQVLMTPTRSVWPD